jgi:cell division protein FtsA
MKEIAAEEAGTVSRRYLAEIIESRLAEMFELVNNEVKAAGRSGRCAGGVVLVGGGAKLPGLTNLARQELKLSSHIGSALTEGWHADTAVSAKLFQDPEFVNVLGLSLLGVDHEGGGGSMFQMPKVRGLRELLRYFTP